MLGKLRKFFSNRLVLALLVITLCLLAGPWLYRQDLEYWVTSEAARLRRGIDQMRETSRAYGILDVPMPTDTDDPAAWIAYIYADDLALEMLMAEHQKAIKAWKVSRIIPPTEYGWRYITPYIIGMSDMRRKQEARIERFKEHLHIEVERKDPRATPYNAALREQRRAFYDASSNVPIARANFFYAESRLENAITVYKENRGDLYRDNPIEAIVKDPARYRQVMLKSELDAEDAEVLTAALSAAITNVIESAGELESILAKRDAAWDALLAAAAEIDGSADADIAEDPLRFEKEVLYNMRTNMSTLHLNRYDTLISLSLAKREYGFKHEALYRDNRIDADTEDPEQHREAMAKSAADLEDALGLASEIAEALPKAVEKNRELAAGSAEWNAAWDALLAAAAAKGISESEIGVEKGIAPNPLPDAIRFPEVPKPVCPACERPATEISEHVAHCEDPLHEKNYPYFRCVQERCPISDSHTAEEQVACAGGCGQIAPKEWTYRADEAPRRWSQVKPVGGFRYQIVTISAHSTACPEKVSVGMGLFRRTEPCPYVYYRCSPENTCLNVANHVAESELE